MKVKLTVRGGKFVAYTEMPPFKLLPKGIAWGQRVFFLTGTEECDSGTGQIRIPIYEEDILWVDPSQIRHCNVC